MSELQFRTTLEPSGPATAVVLTDEQVEQLGGGKSAPVTVTIGGRTARLRLARMCGENLIGLSKAARAELGVEIGDEVDVVVALDREERPVEVPEALATALEQAGLQAAFEALAPSKKKELARQVAEVKAEATRDRRVAKIVEQLGS